MNGVLDCIGGVAGGMMGMAIGCCFVAVGGGNGGATGEIGRNCTAGVGTIIGECCTLGDGVIDGNADGDACLTLGGWAVGTGAGEICVGACICGNGD